MTDEAFLDTIAAAENPVFPREDVVRLLRLGGLKPPPGNSPYVTLDPQQVQEMISRARLVLKTQALRKQGHRY